MGAGAGTGWANARDEGGPPVEALLYTPGLLRTDFAGFEWLHLEACERDVQEGRLHHGHSAVVRLAARKPR